MFNEMYLPDGKVREHFAPLAEGLANMPPERVAEKREADLFHRVDYPRCMTSRAPSA